MSEKRKNKMIIAVSIIIAITLAEGILRLIPERGGSVYIQDDVLNFRISPNVFPDIDDNGYRNKDDSDYYDIVALGDSMTFGSQTTSDETWPKQLGAITESRVYNMGVSGYGPMQYAALTEEALMRKPDAVIWGIFLGNDLFDAYHLVYESSASINWTEVSKTSVRAFADLPNQSVDDTNLLPHLDDVRDSLTLSLRIRNFLRDHFELYELAGQSTRGLRERIGLAQPRGEAQYYDRLWVSQNKDLAFSFDHDSIGTILVPAFRHRMLDITDIRVEEGLRLTLDALTRTDVMLQEHKTKFVVFLIPTKERAYRAIVERDQISVPDIFMLLTEAEQKVIDEILQHCEKKFILCLDLTQSLSKGLLEGRQLYPIYQDDHPVAQGNELIARTVADFLSTHDFFK